MADGRRKDSKGRILRSGEQQRADGRYMYTYTDPVTKKKKYVFSWKLEMRDKVPAGKKVSKSLRELEKEIERDLLNGIACQGGNLTVLELTERYLAQKRNVRPTTQAGYKTVVNFLKEDDFGGKRFAGCRAQLQLHSQHTRRTKTSIPNGGRGRSGQKKSV